MPLAANLEPPEAKASFLPLLFSGRPNFFFLILPFQAQPLSWTRSLGSHLLQSSSPPSVNPPVFPLSAVFCACLAPRRTNPVYLIVHKPRSLSAPRPRLHHLLESNHHASGPPPFHLLRLELRPLRLELAELHGGSRPDSGAGI